MGNHEESTSKQPEVTAALPESDASEGAQHPAASASGSGSDAPPSNRASERCSEEEFLVVWRGIDSLELSFSGTLGSEQAEELTRRKALAQERDPEKQASAVIVLCGHVFQVFDRGARRYPFILQDHRFFIKVKSHAAKHLPLAVAQIRSEYLVHRGVAGAAADLTEIVAALGKVSGEATVSRVDLAADFVSHVDMSTWDPSAWITRAERKDAHTVGERFTGWSIGLGGPVSARLYDKKFEIEMRSKKYYLYDLWQRAGWFAADPVWRLEFQFRRAALNQLSLTTLSDVLRALEGLWKYGTTKWLRLTVPDATDATRARWPLHSLWQCLSDLVWNDAMGPLVRAYAPSTTPSEKAIARAGTSVLTTVMAREGLAEPQKGFLALQGKVMRYWDKQAEWEGISAERLLLAQALAKERKFGIYTLAHKLGLVPAPTSYEREIDEDE